jgi:hypothetical protein
MLVCGLLLVGVAGYFLIGVFGLLRPELFIGRPSPGTPVTLTLSAEERGLILTLYGFAFASLLAAVILFVLGVGWLRRAARESR